MEYIKYIDTFGIKFHFYINNQSYHQNKFGGIITIFYLLICIWIFIEFSFEDFNRSKPISSISEITDIQPRTIFLQNESIWFPFRIVTDENKYIDHRGKLYILPYIVEGIYNNDIGMKLNYHLLNYKLCNETSMVNKPTNFKIDVPLNELFCIFPEKNFIFGGNWNGEFMSYIEIGLYLCDEGIYFNISDPRCQKINDLFKNINSSLSFDFYYPIVEFQPTNFETPLSIIYKNYFYRLSAYSHKLQKIYIQEHILSDDKNFFRNNEKNISFWGISSIFGDDYSINNKLDPLIKNEMNQILTMEIYMDYGLIYYTRAYTKIFQIISNVFPIFRLVLYFIKKITRHIKLSYSKRKLASLLFDRKIIPSKTIQILGKLNNNSIQHNIIKKNESKNDLLKDKNISLINNSLDKHNNTSLNNNKKIKLTLSDENAIKILNKNEKILINSNKKCSIINESLKLKDSSIKSIDTVDNNNNLFSFYYFFLDFIFEKNQSLQKYFCISRKYFVVHNYMSKIYDISTYFFLIKQFNILNNSIKKIYEENGFHLIYPFKKININDNDEIKRVERDINNKINPFCNI